MSDELGLMETIYAVQSTGASAPPCVVDVDPYLHQVVEFLREIGLDVEYLPGATGFTNHCMVVKGTLRIDPRCRASALLHEAGHLAVVPQQYRHLFDGDVVLGQIALMDAVSLMPLAIDSKLYRAAVQAGETEATAWAFACGRNLGIPPEWIIRDDEYSGDGAVERLRLLTNGHLGINGLSFAGFCKARDFHHGDLPTYPELAFWMQPTIEPELRDTHG